ncbi:UNVERIFIED_CONTAM: Serine/arginine-rich SC35-like splicing factor SCL30A [Sesamum calycinum]|uniref:Serine/arginine-rich SC35-like splicing factor SCL30A n=1 Tax=Sesamum calycinum TaxID=2727403 RepID=A0AAW2SBF9_9LAMI
MRGRSYTPSPPRGYGRRGRSPPRGGRYGRGDAPTSLLVRNLRHDCRPEDLRRPFGQFGPIKDIYLPRDYYTGPELTVVFAEENRKKPTEMRARERGGRGRVHDRRRSPPRYSRSPQYSQSPPPRHGRSRSRNHDYYSPPKRRYSRSISPREKGYSRERSLSRTPLRERSPAYDGPRNHSGSTVRERSPYGSRSRSQSPGHGPSPVRARSLSRSRSPYSPEYSRKPGRAGSPSQ